MLGGSFQPLFCSLKAAVGSLTGISGCCGCRCGAIGTTGGTRPACVTVKRCKCHIEQHKIATNSVGNAYLALQESCPGSCNCAQSLAVGTTIACHKKAVPRIIIDFHERNDLNRTNYCGLRWKSRRILRRIRCSRHALAKCSLLHCAANVSALEECRRSVPIACSLEAVVKNESGLKDLCASRMLSLYYTSSSHFCNFSAGTKVSNDSASSTLPASANL